MVNQNLIKIGIDKKRTIKNFITKRFITNIRNFPREKPELSVLTIQEIITHYNQVMNGFARFYFPLITYQSHINRWLYILYYSCLKTLATKLRKSIKEITNIYGFKDITDQENQSYKITHQDQRIVFFYIQDDQEKVIVLLNYKEIIARCRITMINKIIQPNHYTLDTDFLNSYKKYWRTHFKLTTACVVCGSKEHLESHHIRKLNYSKAKGFHKVLSQLNRKQIVICRPCHNNVHSGKYNGLSLNDLHAKKLAICESLIHTFRNTEPNANKSLLLMWPGPTAYKLDLEHKTIRSEYIAAAKAAEKKELFPKRISYLP
jgi:hypothetical protein